MGRFQNFYHQIQRGFRKKKLILGIESTFDDSGAAVLDENGKVLGESLRSQLTKHKSCGGVNPELAMKLHEENLPKVVDEAMERAGISFKELSALATATKPGLAMSLSVGLNFSKKLIADHNLPFIPVHHMEAHALTVRMIEKIDFPFLVLLASGGNCLLCLAQGLGDYKIIGQGLDEPPGAVFDKVAREMGLLTDERFSKMSGGQAVEVLARGGNSLSMPFTVPMTKVFNSRTKSCNFSFSGLQTQVLMKIEKLKQINALDETTCKNVAAGFQHAAVEHIIRQIYRGILFCEMKNLLPDSAVLVVSGGVAANSYFRNTIAELSRALNVKLIFPPTNLCTDNGIMIAWAGMEYLKQGIGIAEKPNEVRYEPKSAIGEYIGSEVVGANIVLPQILPWKK